VEHNATVLLQPPIHSLTPAEIGVSVVSWLLGELNTRGSPRSVTNTKGTTEDMTISKL